MNIFFYKKKVIVFVLVLFGISSLFLFQNCSEIKPLTSEGEFIPDPGDQGDGTGDNNGDGGDSGDTEPAEESAEEYCARLEATSTDPFFTPAGWTFDPEAWTRAFPRQTIPAGYSVAPYIPLARTGYTGTRFTLPADTHYTVQLRSGGDAHGVKRASGHMIVISKCRGDFRQIIPNADLVKHPWESPRCRTLTVNSAGYMLTITSHSWATSGCKLPPGEYFFNSVYAGWGPGFLVPACPADAIGPDGETVQCTRAWMVNP